MSDPVARFTNERWTAGVLGLGYVGLPLLVAAFRAGLDVIGFDVDRGRIDSLRTGTSHIDDVPDSDIADLNARGGCFTSDPGELARADALIIAVPSPLGHNREPDLSYIEAAADLAARVARPGQLVSLESTTYPGTTEDIIVPALTARGLELDRDVFVCFSPERVDPGNPLGTAGIPKLIGGVTPRSGEVAAAAYGRLIENVYLVSDARTAEFTKLLENTYRAVNIALVNELAQISHGLDIDIWEAVDAAATKPFGFQAFYPGPGVGGHCIPLDPQYLAWRAREAQISTRFIDLADEVNLHMPDWVTDRAAELLGGRGLAVPDTPVLLVGMSYKANVADDRESPSIEVMTRIAARGARLGLYDPLIEPARLAAHGHQVVTSPTDGSWELAVILTDHDDVDYKRLAQDVPLILDTRGAFRRRDIRADNVVTI